MALYTDTTGTIKETKVLVDQALASETSLELQELIETIVFILWFEADTKKSMIDKSLVEKLKVSYSKLTIRELRLLFWDNYYSMMELPFYKPENACSILVRNKVLALGTLIKSQL